MASSNLVLIGFMGSGKSSAGREAARISGRMFVDTDALIESWQGRSIADIFAKEGEPAFRELECALVRWMKENLRSAVIATGGGMPFAGEDLHGLGEVVFLDLPFEAIRERVRGEEAEKRPLFDEEKAHQLFEKRLPGYRETADRIVAADREITEVARELCRHSS